MGKGGLAHASNRHDAAGQTQQLILQLGVAGEDLAGVMGAFKPVGKGIDVHLRQFVQFGAADFHDFIQVFHLRF
ncbi:MAG: hypothetical protein BWY83_02064 [bacterium ADurb.Bin478]|nr:MAG: hypothetical protein BWY83_02064 [bacterium ADurb.Bin478]